MTRSPLPALRLLLPLLLTLGGAYAQNATVQSATALTLPSAVARALAQGVDVTSARASLQKAQANLRAVRADPTSLITTLTQAEQEVAAQAAVLDAAKLGAAQAAISGYLSAYEGAARVTLAGAQVGLSERNLKIAQARLAARTATALDVSRAQNALNSDRQDLASARASLPVLEASLARTLNLQGDLNLSAPPAAPKLSVTLAALQAGLEKRLPSLVQAANGAALAALQVRLSDNDYTPARTLEDARVAAQNAQRTLDDALRAAQTGVRDAYRAAQDAQERVALAREALQNARTALTQAQARLKAGTAAAVEVQQAQLQVSQAEFSLTQAQGGVWRALAGLGTASGVDVTGLVN
ncbi:TolC family protein [Deinococcus multiflagellatus]|uniref:TolC family protein n=1 Tax=Deinococcus multiflagellatus TaxID=1656887 RepID=A0ABW1ZR70_9DEIO|nr:TolC family protein [Deinococcus multiflagellatus]MBZ9713558.1 TolC family protein [Deinococcus multiflagellatus]